MDTNERDEMISPDTLRKERIPPGQRRTTGFPVLQKDDVQHVDRAGWRFRAWGLVKKELTLTLAEFEKLPRVKVFCDLHCVTTWSRLDNVFEGVPTLHFRKMLDIEPGARAVMVHGAGDFTTNLLLDDFFQEDVVFALRHNGKPIDDDHGAPVRLVVPRLYLWKSAKWVTGIEFIPEDRPGYWESHGYHIRGDPWCEERYS